MEKYYHFTTVDTLVSMLTDSLKFEKNTSQRYIEFWATDITVLNDTTERNLFVDLLVDKVRKYATEKKTKLTIAQEKELGKLCYSDMYVISFTSTDLSLSDELNMWRGYSGSGHGVCLELDFSKVPAFYVTNNDTYQMENTFRPQKCKYINADEIEIDKDLVRQLYEELNSSEKDYIKGTLAQSSLISRIAKIAPYYKHIAYKSEYEYRLVIPSLEEPQYKKIGNIIKPHIIYRIPISAISSIKIGPCIKDSDSIKSLENFILSKLGKEVEIKYSEIPFRG